MDVLALLLAALITTGPAYIALHRKLGKPNGGGNVVDRLGRIEQKIDEHTRDREAHRY